MLMFSACLALHCPHERQNKEQISTMMWISYLYCFSICSERTTANPVWQRGKDQTSPTFVVGSSNGYIKNPAEFCPVQIHYCRVLQEETGQGKNIESCIISDLKSRCSLGIPAKASIPLWPCYNTS